MFVWLRSQWRPEPRMGVPAWASVPQFGGWHLTLTGRACGRLGSRPSIQLTSFAQLGLFVAALIGQCLCPRPLTPLLPAVYCECECWPSISTFILHMSTMSASSCACGDETKHEIKRGVVRMSLFYVVSRLSLILSCKTSRSVQDMEMALNRGRSRTLRQSFPGCCVI